MSTSRIRQSFWSDHAVNNLLDQLFTRAYLGDNYLALSQDFDGEQRLYVPYLAVLEHAGNFDSLRNATLNPGDANRLACKLQPHAVMAKNFGMIANHVADEASDANPLCEPAMTPLLLALSMEHLTTAKSLIDGGADVNQTNGCGVTPLYMLLMAAYRHDGNSTEHQEFEDKMLNLFQLLIQKSARLETVCNVGYPGGEKQAVNYLAMSIFHKHYKIANFLLQNHADVVYSSSEDKKRVDEEICYCQQSNQQNSAEIAKLAVLCEGLRDKKNPVSQVAHTMSNLSV